MLYYVIRRWTDRVIKNNEEIDAFLPRETTQSITEKLSYLQFLNPLSPL